MGGVGGGGVDGGVVDALFVGVVARETGDDGDIAEGDGELVGRRGRCGRCRRRRGGCG